MDINDLFSGIMKSINQFTVEIAQQRLQEKSGKPDEVLRIRVKMRRNYQPKEKRGMTDSPKME